MPFTNIKTDFFSLSFWNVSHNNSFTRVSSCTIANWLLHNNSSWLCDIGLTGGACSLPPSISSTENQIKIVLLLVLAWYKFSTALHTASPRSHWRPCFVKWYAYLHNAFHPSLYYRLLFFNTRVGTFSLNLKWIKYTLARWFGLIYKF